VPRPELSVVVAADDRLLRLRWLLNALEQQTLDADLWEVVVGHDAEDNDTAALLAEHALAVTGRLHAAMAPSRASSPGAMRNAALRLSRGDSVVFTDVDCRPTSGWLVAVRAAVGRHPGAIIQGPVRRDPEEQAMMYSPFPRTREFAGVPRVWADSANIAYPRALLEEVGGFAEDLPTGEDTDLGLRCRDTGAEQVGEPTMLTYSAIDEGTLLTRLAGARRLARLAPLVRRQPRIRRHLPLWLFVRRSHAWLPLAMLGARLERRNPLWVLLIAPWAIQYEFRPLARGRVRDVMELPGRALIDMTEVAVLVAASLRHRTVLL
jgi:hypothetical protein